MSGVRARCGLHPHDSDLETDLDVGAKGPWQGASGLDDETRERFLEGNARRILGLDRDRSAAE